MTKTILTGGNSPSLDESAMRGTNRQEAEDVEAFGACSLCGEPIDGEELGLVERFEGHGDLVCQACGEEELAASEEAQDLRRANPLEPDFRRMGE